MAHIEATQIYSDDPRVVKAGLRDGAMHQSCESCRCVMLSACEMIDRLLAEREERKTT